MRILGLLAQLLVPVVSAATLGWWLARLLMGALVRGLERRKALASGPLPAAIGLLLGCLAGVSAVAVGVALLLFWLLLTAPSLVGLEDHHPAARVWHVLVWIAAILAAGAGLAGATIQATATLGASRRRWELLGLHDPAHAQVGVPVPEGSKPAASQALLARPSGRRIVILCDGTSNRPDEQEDGEDTPTNIWKLFRALVSDEVQTTWYQAGVGSDSSSTSAQVRQTQATLSFFGANTASQVAANFRRLVKVVEGAFGTGISETILNGYAEIVRQYRPGDRIYLVGFSRGAYAARCIAGVISHCGLLRAENIRYAPQMVQIYRTRPDPKRDAHVQPGLLHRDPAIEFVGVFDTVASLGVPLWGWWFRVFPIWRNKSMTTDPVRACRHVYHALAMDERRSEFLPALYMPPDTPRPDDKLETLEQVWFRGAHADIGGGYARTDLSDITLGWMMAAMARHGLRFREDARAKLRPDALGRLHDELVRKPSWTLLGSWPRWHPVPGAGLDATRTKLHQSVLDRTVAVQAQAGRPDLLRLQPGEHFVFTADAPRTWDRTGIVIESGGAYRLTYLGDVWRDASSPPCGPAGQRAQGALDLRRWWTFGRRLPRAAWMRLIITVAHPRQWPLQEKGLRELVPLLLRNDPVELTRQLAAVGGDLAVPGDAVLLHNLASAGLLHLFANDWWQTASNNSGGVRMRIERLEELAPGLRTWTLLADGSWFRA